MTPSEFERAKQTTNRSGVTVRVFGSTGLTGDEPVSIGGPRQRRLLALLAIRSGVMVTIDWLAEHLWSDDDRPDAAAAALRTYVSRLRSSMPEDVKHWIETQPSGYRLAAPSEAVEHEWFAQLRADATAARAADDPQAAIGLLDEALGLWRGEPFRELEDSDWARPTIEKLELDRLEMLEERWEAALALGRHTQITGELSEFTQANGMRERATRQHALALHRSARTTEALRVLAEYRKRLVTAGGLDPSLAFEELEASLLRGDASLEVSHLGRPLRGYRLLEEIGQGAFSVVWRGIQPSVDRDVAIKQIRSGLASEPDFIRRFEAEAQLVARIEHPHIVPLIDFWRDPGSAYLVMRWLRGGTLEQLLDHGPLSVDQTLRMAQQIGGALGAAHAHGVVHRDVKTANILLDEQGNAFLSDFGIALESNRSSGPEAALSPGSPAYASPEQIRRQRLGPEADVFSLAVVVFECLTGSLPFADTPTVDDLIDRQLHDAYPTLSELRSDVPLQLSEAVARATEKHPAERFASVADFVDDLTRGAPLELRHDLPATMDNDQPIENPYRGLLAFDGADRSVFFGRRRVVAELIDRLGGESISSRCLLLVGPSGSGKSSVVRAGLIPALREQDVGDGGPTGSAEWFMTTMVPGTKPFEALEAALLRVAVNPPDSLLAQLTDGPRGILRSVCRCMPDDKSRVLLVVDQFEEIFTGSSSGVADSFLSALSVAVSEPTSPLRLIGTLRADYYDRPLQHPTFAAILKACSVDLTPLAPDELEQTIVEPARSVGVEFVPGLVARIAAETYGQRSPLPALQYALSELFERRSLDELTASAYDDIGGLSGALASRAESIFAAASQPEQEATRWIFGRMLSPTAVSADLRVRVAVADLGDDPTTTTVLDRFGSARLIAFDRNEASREPTVEVAHEALVREWPRLQQWLEADREVLRTVDAIGRAVGLWDHGGRVDSDLYRDGRLETATTLRANAPERLRAVDVAFIEASQSASERQKMSERRRIKRLRQLVTGIAAALVVALIAGGLALREQRRASDTAEAANAAAAEAELATLLSRSAALAVEDPTQAVLLALEANRRAPESTPAAVLHALSVAPASSRTAGYEPLAGSDCPGGQLAADASREFGVRDGRLTTRDFSSGQISDHGPAAAPCVYWFEDPAANLRVQLAPDQTQAWFGPADGPPTYERQFETPIELIDRGTLATGVLPAVSFTETEISLLLLDAETGEQLAPPVPAGDNYFGALDVSSDGSIAVIGSTNGSGRSLVVDTTSGAIVHEILTNAPVNQLVIDDRTNQLLLAQLDGNLSTYDLDSASLVSTVPVNIGDGLFDLDIRTDGVVVMVTSGSVELVDRSAGHLETLADLRDVVFARYRPSNGLVVVVPPDRMEVLEFGENVLVERAFEVPSQGFVAFGAGHAVITEAVGGNRAETIDLASGERTDLVFEFEDGSPFVQGAVWVEDGSHLAFNPDSSIIARWVDGAITERVDLGTSSVWGHRNGDVLALIALDENGNENVELFDVTPGAMHHTAHVPSLGAHRLVTTVDGGVHVIDNDGRLNSHGPNGDLLGGFETEIEGAELMRLDPTSGRLAISGFGEFQGIRIVDPQAQTVNELTELGTRIANVEWARNGELLVVTGRDGTVRLWDVERGESLGLVFNGAGAPIYGSQAWYDPSTETVWVTSSGRILQIPVTPERWIDKACEFVGRDFNNEEWDRLVPGDEPLQSGCD